MKTPLIILTVAFGLAFLDGFLELGMSDGMSLILGIAMITALIWMWVVQAKS